jgi:REP element-mobilizing transposase RayT
MPHSFCSSLYHCVFSTKERRPLIVSDLQPRLWNFIGGVARERGCKSLIVGGMPDHVHILLSLPSTIAVADAMREIKHGSSLWMHEMIQSPHFAWQEGYGAFSIGWKQLEATVAYIEQQTEHHKKRDFQEEFLAMLKMHQIECDSRYIFG